MEVLQPSPGTAPKAKASKHTPRTPPYTPMHNKRRFERSDSPASVSSIQPTETTSPAKKAAKRDVPDNVWVEELVEGDAGYITDIDVVYPEELEETPSSISEYASSEAEDEGTDSDTGISQRFEQLGCDDDDDNNEEAEFEKKRRESHARKRTSSRLYKRTHAQSIKSESEASDVEAMGDHDLSGSARRLRRRVKGPAGIEIFDDMPRNSPDPGSAGLASPLRVQQLVQQDEDNDSSEASDGEAEAMDVRND